MKKKKQNTTRPRKTNRGTGRKPLPVPGREKKHKNDFTKTKPHEEKKTQII